MSPETARLVIRAQQEGLHPSIALACAGGHSELIAMTQGIRPETVAAVLLAEAVRIANMKVSRENT